MLALTKQAAEFASAIKVSDIPARGLEAATIGIADCVGVMIAGAEEEPVRIVSAMVPAMSGDEAAPEIPYRADGCRLVPTASTNLTMRMPRSHRRCRLIVAHRIP